MMQIFKTRAEVTGFSEQQRAAGKEIGFVPTMGALHAGHISLVNHSKAENDVTVVSIFVNPTQFNDKNDFLKYPTSTDQDLEMLLTGGCDAVFLPSVEEIYPEDQSAIAPVVLGYLAQCMEASRRPGHFDGVVQVVDILLRAVQPDRLYLGAKDFQQVKVITALVEQRQWPIKIITAPTIREEDGLAMSSRNRRLSPEQRRVANILFNTLKEISAQAETGSPAVLTKSYIEKLNQTAGLKVDYLEIVDYQTLRPLENWNQKGNNLVCVAAYLGDIRLIDNLLF